MAVISTNAAQNEASIITNDDREITRVQCNVNKPGTLSAGFSIQDGGADAGDEEDVTCSETPEGVKICVKDDLPEPLSLDLTEEEIEDGAFERETNFEVDHVASFVLALQPEWWLPLQDDEQALVDLTNEICRLVETV